MFGIFVFGEFSYVWSGPMMMRMTIVTVMTIIKMIFRVCWFDNIISAWTMVIILVKITSCPSQWQQHQVYAKWTSGEHSSSICCIFCLKNCWSFYYKSMSSRLHTKGVGKMCPMAGYSMFPHRLKVFENENNVSCNFVISANAFFQIEVIGDPIQRT